MGKMIGESIKRVEDHRFITGAGEYTDDIVLARMTHAYVLRSQLAHAKIKSIDTAAASRRRSRCRLHGRRCGSHQRPSLWLAGQFHRR